MKIAKKIIVYTEPNLGIEPTVHHSVECLKHLFTQIENLKHHCLLALTYSGELSRSKTLNLQVENVDYTCMKYE